MRPWGRWGGTRIGLNDTSVQTLAPGQWDIQYSSVHWTLDKTVMDPWQVITEEVYSLLESRGGLERREVILAKESEASSSKQSGASNSKEARSSKESSSRSVDESVLRSFVFVSPGFESKERLQVKTLHSSTVPHWKSPCSTVSQLQTTTKP